MPGIWQVRKKGHQIIALKAISIPGCCPPKIGYSSRGCSSTTVKLNSGVDLYTLWKLVPVNGTIEGMYQIIPDQLFGCKSTSYTLGIKKKGSSGAASLSSCGHSVGLVANGSLNSGVPKIYWKFNRVNDSPLPPLKPSLPPPRPALEKTRVIATTFITQPNGQSCSSLSQEELRNITTTLCIQQIDYITTNLGWPRQQTDCSGTARCLGARQSTGASEHTTDLSLIYTPSQNQTAEEVATSLTRAMNKPQTFYAADFGPNTDITLSDSTIIPPGGAPSNPSPAPSPTPVASPSPTPAPIFVPSPTPTPIPSGGGGGGGGSPPITAPGVPTSAIFSVNTAAVGTINAAWVAPAASGGAAVTYDIQCTVNTGTAPSLITGVSATSYALTGLTLGTTYACGVCATNSAGSSAYSTAVTGLTIPATAPGVPTSAIFSVNTAAVGTINAAWVAPAASGGAAVTYDIQCTVNTGTAPSLITGVSATSYALTGLTPVAVYACGVRATNSAGSSAYSTAVTGLAIPATVPDPPTIGAFSANTGAYGAYNAEWTAAYDGGAALTSYSIMCTPNAGPAVTTTGISTSSPVCTGNICSTVLTGLANTGTYICKALAVNSAGSSAYSDSSNSFVLATGAIWTHQTTTVRNRWWAIAYGGGYYAVISQTLIGGINGNLVITSTDGITWSNRLSPDAILWSAITYGANQFIAVASSGTSAGQIMTSATGGSWTLRSHPASCQTWKGIAYGDGVYVVVGDSGTDRVMTSTDGISWTAVVAPQNDWRSVTYGGTPGSGGMFVAVAAFGGLNQIMTSATGGSWTLRATAASSQLSWTSVTYGGGRYLAVANSAAQTSPDGEVWTYQTGALTGSWVAATYCGGTFAAIVSSGQKIMTSSDLGVNWVMRDPGSSQSWRSLACGPDKIVGVATTYDQVTTSLF